MSFVYPYTFPTTPYLPWIWDAVFDPVNQQVEVITIPPTACNFNKTQWLDMIDIFPMYKSYLAEGLESNINIPCDAKNIYAHYEKEVLNDIILKGKLTCEFYAYNDKDTYDSKGVGVSKGSGNMNQNKLVYSVDAVVHLNQPFATIFANHIICPLDKFYSTPISNSNINNSNNNNHNSDGNSDTNSNRNSENNHNDPSSSSKPTSFIPKVQLKFRQYQTNKQDNSVNRHKFMNEYISPSVDVHISENHKWPKHNQNQKNNLNNSNQHHKGGGSSSNDNNLVKHIILLEPLSLHNISYLYNLTVCTANDRLDRLLLVEWIEYHLLAGVQHFYIYDTSISSSSTSSLNASSSTTIDKRDIDSNSLTRKKTNNRNNNSNHNNHNNNNNPLTSSTATLSDILFDYIQENIITIIPWHYHNCAKKMASGRQFFHIHPRVKKEESYSLFQPPRAIAQTAALASCYARYRRNSKYIAHIDEDEFLVISLQQSKHQRKPQHNNNNRQQRHQKSKGSRISEVHSDDNHHGSTLQVIDSSISNTDNTKNTDSRKAISDSDMSSNIEHGSDTTAISLTNIDHNRILSQSITEHNNELLSKQTDISSTRTIGHQQHRKRYKSLVEYADTIFASDSIYSDRAAINFTPVEFMPCHLAEYVEREYNHSSSRSNRGSATASSVSIMNSSSNMNVIKRGSTTKGTNNDSTNDKNNLDYDYDYDSISSKKDVIMLENHQQLYHYNHHVNTYYNNHQHKQNISKSILTKRNNRYKNNNKRHHRRSNNHNIYNNNATTKYNYQTPRLSLWNVYNVGLAWEGKLIMRTEAVHTFFVHYIVTVESSWLKYGSVSSSSGNNNYYETSSGTINSADSSNSNIVSDTPSFTTTTSTTSITTATNNNNNNNNNNNHNVNLFPKGGTKDVYTPPVAEAATNHYRVPGCLTANIYSTFVIPGWATEYNNKLLLIREQQEHQLEVQLQKQQKQQQSSVIGSSSSSSDSAADKSNHLMGISTISSNSLSNSFRGNPTTITTTTISSSKYATDRDITSKLEGDYNGINCMWPLSCQRQSFAHICQNTQSQVIQSYWQNAKYELINERNNNKNTNNNNNDNNNNNNNDNNNSNSNSNNNINSNSNNTPTDTEILKRVKLNTANEKRISIKRVLVPLAVNFEQRMIANEYF